MIVIGIAGGSGSGKTTVVKKIMKRFPDESVTVIPQDNYYKDNGDLPENEKKLINFDHPSSIEFDLLTKHIKSLKEEKKIQMPQYSYITCGRLDETITIEPSDVVIIEGILILTDPMLTKLMDVKVFVDADSDDRLIRIIMRDMKERGRTYMQAIAHYEETVKPMHLQFIEPSKRHADIIIPQGGENKVGIDILSSCVKSYLHKQNNL